MSNSIKLYRNSYDVFPSSNEGDIVDFDIWLDCGHMALPDRAKFDVPFSSDKYFARGDEIFDAEAGSGKHHLLFGNYPYLLSKYVRKWVDKYTVVISHTDPRDKRRKEFKYSAFEMRDSICSASGVFVCDIFFDYSLSTYVSRFPELAKEIIEDLPKQFKKTEVGVLSDGEGDTFQGFGLSIICELKHFEKNDFNELLFNLF